MDVEAVTNAVVPYLTALAGAYGGAVLERVRSETADTAADATVGFGVRLLRRFRAATTGAPQVEAAVITVADQPADPAAHDALRTQVRQLLAADAELARDVSRMLTKAGAAGGRFDVSVDRSQGVQIGSGNIQHNTFSRPTK